MKSLNFKTGSARSWGLVLILVGLAAVVFQVRPARSAEIRPTTMKAADGFGGREIPSSARTRQYDDKVLFRYLDEDFVSVGVAGSFNDWELVPMDLDPKSGAWSVTLGMDPGRYSYQFIVRDPAGSESIDGIPFYYPLAGRTIMAKLEFNF